MAVMSLSKTMKSLLKSLKADYPHISFVQGKSFFWSPGDQTVTFAAHSEQPEVACWSLLHEVSHGILGHQSYKTDFELVQLEVQAWQHAQELAAAYGLEINADHIQDCLDTYRDWLHRRSTCPACTVNSAQKDPATYHCLNCRTVWKVSNSRFCRPYRRLVADGSGS